MKLASLLPVASALLLAQTGFAKPFITVAKKSLHAKAQAKVLFEGDDYALLKSPDATPQDFSDLYWVRLNDKINIDMTQYGEVLSLVKDKYAVMRLSEGNASSVSDLQHEAGMACGGLFRLLGDTVTMVDSHKAATPSPIRASSEDIGNLHELVNEINPNNIRTTVESLSSYTTRYHTSATGRGIAQTLAQQYQSLANGRSDVTATTFSHGNKTPQNSLHVTIRGKTRPNEIIVLSSHIDSIAGFFGTLNAPGADDNASGTATNLEIFRLIMEKGLSFDRTIEIHGYAAEEIGLVGSQDMAEKYRASGKKVVAVFQIDMNLYRDSGGVDKIWFVTNDTNPTLTNDLIAYANRYVGVANDTAILPQTVGTSDHLSWTRQGFAAAFPSENPKDYNHKIHTPNDTIANSGAFSQAAAFAKLGLSYVAHYAGLTE